MFLPGVSSSSKAEEKAAFARVEALVRQLLPPNLQTDLDLSLQHVQCGDPSCAPIDTILHFVYANGAQGTVGLPMEAKDVTLQELEAALPPARVFADWQKGIDAPWPEEPPLRFEVDDKVECRIGPEEWAPGKVVQQWYRETNWPPNSFAPYQVQLDDGRLIYAPADVEQVIRSASA